MKLLWITLQADKQTNKRTNKKNTSAFPHEIAHIYICHTVPYCLRDASVSDCLCSEIWQPDIVSDLYIVSLKDPDSCKQHCNQCPICSHVPLVWMHFCHFFHPLPSGCLRTSNPEKRAHLPQEERSKTRFSACLLAWKLGHGSI